MGWVFESLVESGFNAVVKELPTLEWQDLKDYEANEIKKERQLQEQREINSKLDKNIWHWRADLMQCLEWEDTDEGDTWDDNGFDND